MPMKVKMLFNRNGRLYTGIEYLRTDKSVKVQLYIGDILN